MPFSFGIHPPRNQAVRVTAEFRKEIRVLPGLIQSTSQQIRVGIRQVIAFPRKSQRLDAPEIVVEPALHPLPTTFGRIRERHTPVIPA